MPRIGQMRDRVTLQSESRAADGAGGDDRSWVDGDTVWCEIVPLNAREQLDAAALNGKVMYRVSMRHRTDITAEHRLAWGTKYLNVRAATDPTGRRQVLELLAEEGVTS